MTGHSARAAPQRGDPARAAQALTAGLPDQVPADPQSLSLIRALRAPAQRLPTDEHPNPDRHTAREEQP